MALEESLGVTLPNIPFGGKPGSAGKAYQDFLTVNEPKAQLAQTAKQEVELGKQQIPMQAQADVAGAKAAGAEQTAKQISEMPALAEYKEAVKSRPAFVPTKESAQDIMNLFTLTTVIGFALGGAGKSHAQQALSAMNGMVEGHIKGREDLYKKEKDIYDENMKALDRMIEGLKTEISQGTELAKLGGTAATEKLTQAAYGKGATTMGDLAKKLPAVAFLDNFKQISENWAKVSELASKEEQRAAGEKAAMDRIVYERTHPTITPEYKEVQYQMKDGSTQLGTFNARSGKYLDAQNQPMDMSQVKGANTVSAAAKATKGSQADQRFAYNIVQNFEAATSDLKNVGALPAGTVLGTFAGMTGQSGSGLLSSLENTFARKLTPADQRSMQQIITGLDQNLGRVMGGGYANSSAKHVIDAYKEQVARQGDSPAAMALFIARVKQELANVAKTFKSHPGANEGYVDQLRGDIETLDELYPFDVNDVLEAGRKGRASYTDEFKRAATGRFSNTVPSETSETKPTLSDDDYKSYAAKHNISVDEARKFLRSQGYK